MIEITSISRDARALIKKMALSLLLPSRFSVPSSCLASRPSLESVRIFLSNKFFSSQRHFIKHMSCNTTSSEPAAATAEGNAAGEDNREPNDVLVQYVVLRRDLIESWPLGSVVTQGCHASVAAIWSNRNDDLTARYCSDGNLDSMHKVTLEVKGEAQILNLSEKLKEGGITHKLWIEQPENIPTCLATKPYPKSVVSSFFRRLKLCK